MGLFRTRAERQADRQENREQRQEDRAARSDDPSGSSRRRQRRADRQARGDVRQENRQAGRQEALEDFLGITAQDTATEHLDTANEEALIALGFTRDPTTGELIPPAGGYGTSPAAAPLNPYANAGADAIGAQGDLLGLNGIEAQEAAIAALESGPMFTSMMEQGENSILQNASATGGLRGGNTQAALGTLGPQVLSMLMQNQLGGLGGVAGIGAGAAGQQAGLGAGNLQDIVDLLGQGGEIDASGELATSGTMWQMYQDLIAALAGGLV